ncbi:MAG: ABC transporter permease, partial [Planctomycetes bacterium]|nr:ABC transporter permease [Planctomycetota bacterium]
MPEPAAEKQLPGAPPGPAARGLSGLSKQVVAAWLLACVGVPLAILLPAGETGASAVVGAAALAAAGVAVGIAYARRVRVAWHLMQACMLVGVFLGVYWSNRWLFVGESVLFIYLYFSLYAEEVRKEFDIHVAPREVGVLLVLLGMCSVLALVRDRFLEGGNLLDLARQFSMVGIMAVGMTMVIILGGIDLSVGSVVAVSGCLATLAIQHADCNIWVAVAVALGAGAAVGLFNGAFVSLFRMAPFVITLGTMSMARS